MGVYYYTYATSISIHALREEGDSGSGPGPEPDRGFLSTPSARRATPWAGHTWPDLKPFLSTPSARRATAFRTFWNCEPVFLSTPSARRATPGEYAEYLTKIQISIHALREEGDL